MKATGKGLLAGVVLSLALGSAAFAQRGGGQFQQGGANLLRRPEVQTELKLTEAQKGQVEAMLQQQREQRQAAGQGGLRNLTPEQRQARVTEEINRVNAILNADQQKRFKQISLQQQGLSALALPSMAQEMKLTDAQSAKIRELIQERTTALQTLAQNAGDDRQGLRTKTEELRKSSDAKIEAVLTDAQKAQWKDMLGTPFQLAPGGGRQRQN
jgi:Spy/CpxP family protein refolding chaperone